MICVNRILRGHEPSTSPSHALRRVSIGLLAVLTGACSKVDNAGGAARVGSAAKPIACVECPIQLAEVGVLREPAPEVGFTPASKVHALTDGAMVVVPVGDGSKLLVVDSAGMPIGTRGGRGEGPGEFRRIVAAAAHDDGSLTLVSQRGLEKYSPGFEREAHVTPSGPVSRIGTDPWGGIVAAVHGGPGRPLSRYDARLNLVAAGGEATRDPYSRVFVMVASGKQELLAVRQALWFEVLAFDSTLALQRTLRPAVDWFPWTDSGLVPVGDPAGERPTPFVNGAYVDASGRLWVSALVADQDWTPSVARGSSLPGREPERPIGRSPEELAELLDTILQVVDTRTGEPLSTRRYDGVVGGITSKGIAFELIEDPVSGGHAIRLMRLSLKDGALVQ